MSKKETLKEAGYKYIKALGNGGHVLKNASTGALEVWAANKNHASYGLLWRNTHLEFCYSVDDKEARYTLYVERDPFADPERYADGIAWRSGIIDANTGEEIDGEGDIATYEEARELAINTLARLNIAQGAWNACA